MTDPIDLARTRFASLGTLDGPYFRFLEEEPSALAGFRRSQVQFFFAVRSFPRSLAYLAARIEESAARLALVRNLWEEHGEGEAGGFHVSTFDTFLRRLGVDPAEIESSEPGPEVTAFNVALHGLAHAEPVPTAAAALGMIEFMFSSISAALAKLALSKGWIEEGRMVHYDLHSALDVEHAAELFEVVRDAWATDAGRIQIARGIDLGGYLFDRLYVDLADQARRAAFAARSGQAIRA